MDSVKLLIYIILFVRIQLVSGLVNQFRLQDSIAHGMVQLVLPSILQSVQWQFLMLHVLLLKRNSAITIHLWKISNNYLIIILINVTKLMLFLKNA